MHTLAPALRQHLPSRARTLARDVSPWVRTYSRQPHFLDPCPVAVLEYPGEIACVEVRGDGLATGAPEAVDGDGLGLPDPAGPDLPPPPSA